MTEVKWDKEIEVSNESADNSKLTVVHKFINIPTDTHEDILVILDHSTTLSCDKSDLPSNHSNTICPSKFKVLTIFTV